MKYQVEYKKGDKNWTIVRNHGCNFFEADSESAALEYAKNTLADKIHKDARLSARREASELRCYELANNYPDFYKIYQEVVSYQWRVCEWK